MTRFILAVTIALLVLVGILAGGIVAIAALAHHGPAVAALAGVCTALGMWSVAALLCLAIEIADSLRDLVWAAKETTDG